MKKLSYIKLLKSRKGFTLVELLVGLLIFTMITLAVTAFLTTISKLYVKANDMAETNILLDNISNEISNDLYETVEAVVSEDSLSIRTKSNIFVYSIGTGDNEGLLCKNTRPVLDRKYYKGKTVSLEYLDKNKNKITGSVPSAFFIRINLISDGVIVVSRDYAINPLGLNIYS